jgi:hypothetical protein
MGPKNREALQENPERVRVRGCRGRSLGLNSKSDFPVVL